ncbi:hypothetical protein [Aquimarina agarilytica]|uniref:hypothetical protein n=1 Tax=Aquimarina agarilytica TaxID=1087449 RepID=UPI000288FBA2|nr:hypothetical protein [Aquimarina agarilytica]
MKVSLIIVVLFLGICSCKQKIKVNEEVNFSKTSKKIEQEYSTKIISVDSSHKEIASELHYGENFDFEIKVDKTNNLKLLKFCRTNIKNILDNKISDINVKNAIIESFDKEKVMYDEDPKGLRIVTSTEDYDSVSLRIYIYDNNIIKMNLKYYMPL